MVIHSYRHRYGVVSGDAQFEPIERALANRPQITVATIALHGADDSVDFVANSASHSRYFAGPFDRRVLPGVGHNIAEEAPGPFADAVRDVQRMAIPKTSRREA